MKISNLKRLIEFLIEDSQNYTGRNFIRSYFYDVRFRAIFCLRVMQYTAHCKYIPKFVSAILKARLIVKYGIDTTPDVIIGKGLRFVHLGGIVIHGSSVIGSNFTCLNNVTIGQRTRRNLGVPIIGDNVFVGAYTMILGAVKIGDCVSVDAKKLVENDI